MPMSPLISTPLVARNTTYEIEKIFVSAHGGEININASLFFRDKSLFISINFKGQMSFWDSFSVIIHYPTYESSQSFHFVSRGLR